MIFHDEAVFRKTLELSTEDAVAPLEFPDSKFRGRKIHLSFQMHLRTLKVHQKNYLKFLLPKGDLLGIERRCKKERSIKLLLRLSEKA